MLSRSVVRLALLALVFLTSVITSESKRHRGRERADAVRSRDVKKDDEAVKEEKGEGANGNVPAAAAESESESKIEARRCKGCFLSPSARIKVSPSRGPGSRRHRSRHRGRHRSRGHQGRSGRKQHPRRTKNLDESSDGKDEATSRPSERPTNSDVEGVLKPAGTPVERETVSESSRSSADQQTSKVSRASKTGRKKVDDPSSRQREQQPEQDPEQALSDQGLPLPFSASQSSPKSETKSKKKSDKNRKGRRKKAHRGKSSKAKKTEKNAEDESKSSSFWSWFGFPSPDDSGDKTKSEDKSAAEKQGEDSEQPQHHSGQNADQEKQEPKSRHVSDRTRTRHHEGAQDNGKTKKSDSNSDLESEGKPQRRKGRRTDNVGTPNSPSVVRSQKGRKRGNRRDRKPGDDVKPKRERGDDVKPKRERGDDVKPKREREDDVKPKREREDDVKPKQESRDDAKSKRQRGDNAKLKLEREDDVKSEQEREDDVKSEKEREDDAKPKQDREDDVKSKPKRGDEVRLKGGRRGKAKRNRKRGDDAKPTQDREDDVKSEQEREDDVKPKRERGDDVKPKIEHGDDVNRKGDRRGKAKRNRKRGDDAKHKLENRDDLKSNRDHEEDGKRKQEREDDVKPKRERGDDVKPKRERGDDVKPKRERGDDVKPKRERGDDVKPKRERGDDVKPKRERGDDVKPKRERGDDVKPKRERGDDVKSEKEGEEARIPDRDPQDRHSLSSNHQNATRSHGQQPDAPKHHRQRQTASRRNRQRQSIGRRHRKGRRRGRKRPNDKIPESGSHDGDIDKNTPQHSAGRQKESQSAPRLNREHQQHNKEHQDDITENKERHDAVAAAREEDPDDGEDKSGMKSAGKHGRKHHGSGKRTREPTVASQHNRKHQDNMQSVKESHGASGHDRYQLISNLKRRRQDDVGRGRQNAPKRDNPDLKTRRHNGERQKDDKRERDHQKDPERRDRTRQNDMRRDRQRYEGFRRDRYHAYDARNRMAERRERERQRATRNEMERRIASRKEMERKMMVKRHRERQMTARRERERLMAARRERERLIAERREKDRLAFNSRRYRGRSRGRGRDGALELTDYRGRHVDGRPPAYNFPSRPAAADRLERRLSPGVHSHSRALLQSIQRTLSTLAGGLQAVRNVNQFVFNGTRYTIMMGVRKQLTEIAQANDMVYDTILRANLLTKDIYMRAHQHRLTGPTTRSLDRPEMTLPSLYDVIRAAYDEERKAQQTLRNAQEFVRRRKSLSARLQQVREKFQDNFARNDLRTLVYYINSTRQRLGQELTAYTQVAYLRRNTGMLSNSRSNLTVSRDLIYKATDILAKGMEDYRGNYRVVNDWRRARRDDRGVGAPVSIRRRVRSVSFRHSRPIRDITPAERARLRPIIDRAKQHAREQERLALQVERLLRPAIHHGKGALDKEDAAMSAWLSSLAAGVQRDTKKMFSLLDSIRVLIRAEHELRWTYSVGTACAGEGDDVEGSGCDGEGSGALILEGGEEGSGAVPGAPTDDEDFVFVDEKQPPKRARPPSMEEFGEKLSVYLDGVQLRSRDVLERGDSLFEKTEKLSDKWSITKKSYDAADRARRLWKQTKDVMENVTNYVDDISPFALAFSEKVNRSYDSIQSRAQKALEIAERKLSEAQAHKAGGETEDAEKESPADDDTIVIQAVEKAENVRREMRVMRSLRQVTPQSCGRASGQLVNLHANISHLRQQIITAQTLLQTMQLAISKSGGGYLSIPVSEKALTPSPPHSRSQVSTPSLPTPVSMVTTVEVCVRTQDLDGPVLLVKGNNSASFSLGMKGRQVSVTVYDAKGYTLESVISDVTMKEDTWYNVKVIRTGQHVLLKVTSRDGSRSPVDNDISVTSMSHLQPSPVHVYVGGVAENEPFSVGSDSWRGCLAELRVDGRAVPLFHSSSTGEAPQICSSQCGSTVDNGHSLVFNGAGYLHFPSSILPMRRRMESIHFRFRTRQSSAAILHLVNHRQRFLLRVMLTDGALLIDTTTPSESITLRSQSSSYNDGVFHALKIQYRDSTTYPTIDGRDGAFTIERSRSLNLNKMAEGVMIGGFVNGNLEFEKSKYRPLIGCLQELDIDEKPLSVSQAATSVGVYSGSCDSHSVWSQCVQFGGDSTGIDLGPMDHSGTVLLLFSWDARGPLLTYSREGTFEVGVEVTDEGLQVEAEKGDLTIARPEDAADHFILLTITDVGKTVKYSAWGEEVETKYGSFWGASADVDGEHHVQIGAALDTTTDRRLSGQIAQAMVGQRFIDLANYTISNDLEACQRPLPSLVLLDSSPEKIPSTEEEEQTCSKDIRC